LTAEDPRNGQPVRFVAQKPPLVQEVLVDQKPLNVEIDVDDVFLKLGTKQEIVQEYQKDDAFRAECERRHYSAHEKYIVTSIVKGLEFPKGTPPGVTIVGTHVLKVENFGKIFFGELVVGDMTRRLTLLRFQLGSDTGGSSCCGESKPNGQTT